ncbi:MAG: hypothetical protein ABIT83_07760 [Massilia sp.]
MRDYSQELDPRLRGNDEVLLALVGNDEVLLALVGNGGVPLARLPGMTGCRWRACPQ